MNRTIDWSRVAEPQSDGYDSEVALGQAISRGYRRSERSHTPAILEGAVSLIHDPALVGSEGCAYASFDHPNIAVAEMLLRTWPEAFNQCRTLLDSICLYESSRLGPDNIIGSICGSGSTGFGSILVTVNHHVGLAEGIVHEMAHHKLRALGIDMESASQLLTNSSAELFQSPIRYDCLRPMSAVLHAQYSYTYIAQLDLKILESSRDLNRSRLIRERSLAVIIPKLECGLNTILTHVKTDVYGAKFIEGFESWCRRVIHSGHHELAVNEIPVQLFEHPMKMSNGQAVVT